MRSGAPLAMTLPLRSDSAPANAAAPEVPLACFGLGLAVPLLGGGNVLLQLDPAVATPLLLLIALGFAALVGWRSTAAPEATPLRAAESAALLLFVAWSLGNLALRPSGPRATIDAIGLVAGALVFFVLTRRPLPGGSLERLVAGLAAGTLLTALYGQYQHWIMFPAIASEMWARYGQGPFLSVNANFYSANCYAPFLAATLVLLLGVGLRRGGWLPWLAAVPLLVTLGLSGSRATAALLVVVALGLVVGPRFDRRGRRLGLAALALAAPVVLLVGSRWIDPAELWETALLGRVAIWQASLAMIGDHWVLGVGPDRFAEHFPAYQVGDLFTRYPHNQLLKTFAETGIVGFLALAAFFVAAVVASFRAVTDRADVLRRAAFAGAVLLLAHAMVDIDWRAPANPVLLLALLAATRRPAPEATC